MVDKMMIWNLIKLGLCFMNRCKNFVIEIDIFFLKGFKKEIFCIRFISLVVFYGFYEIF